MKFKFKHALLAFAALAMAGGVGAGIALSKAAETEAKATNATVYYLFNSKSWGATTGASYAAASTTANWTSNKDGGQLTSGQGIQVTTTYSGASGTSDIAYAKVSSVQVCYCTNSTKGAGTISVRVGSKDADEQFTVTKPSSGGTTLKDATFDFSTAADGKITITADCTANSIYIYGCAITYDKDATIAELASITGLEGDIPSAFEGASEWDLSGLTPMGTVSGSSDVVDISSFVELSTTSIPGAVGPYDVPVKVTPLDTGSSVDEQIFNVSTSVVANPFNALTKVSSLDSIVSYGSYYLSKDGTTFAATTISGTAIQTTTTDFAGALALTLTPVSGTNSYSLSFTSGTKTYYLNHTGDNTNVSFVEAIPSAEASAWIATATTNGITLNNSNNRRLADSKSDTIKAYQASNDTYVPYFLYVAPLDELSGLALTNQKTTFTAGEALSLGDAYTATATYSISGELAVTSGFTYTLGSSAYVTNTPLTKADDGKNVTVTYTDSKGRSIAATSYPIVVNYAAVESIVLNLSSVELALNGSVTLTATVQSEYADQTVAWSATNLSGITADDFALDNGEFLAGSVAGELDVVATAVGGLTASCHIKISGNPAVTLEAEAIGDVYSNPAADQTLSGTFSNFGAGVTVTAVSSAPGVVEVVGDPIVDTGSFIIGLHYLAGGTATVTVTVSDSESHSVEKTCAYTILQSAVTNIELTSSLANPTILHNAGAFALTPAVTKVGVATDVINWTTSDASIASISSATTSGGTAISVTPHDAGEVTITATSAYTPAASAQYVLTVIYDELKLSWTSRVLSYYVGDTFVLKSGCLNYYYASDPSTKTDVNLTTEGVSATLGGVAVNLNTYQFAAADNGKTLVISYTDGQQVAHSTDGVISVANWRSVSQDPIAGYAFDLSGITEASSSAVEECAPSGTSVTATLSNCYKDNGNPGLRFGAGSAIGSARFVFDSKVKISGVRLAISTYGSDTDVSLKVNGGANNSVPTSGEMTVFLAEASNDITIAGTANKKRFIITSITFLTDLGKTTDCLGLEVFIDSKLAMGSDVEGQCNTLYTPAKQAFEALNDNQKELFTTHDAYTAEYARLKAWAAAKGEAYDSATGTFKALSRGFGISSENSELYITLAVLLGVGAATSVSMFAISKKKKRV